MKRDIFAELVEGFDTLASERQHELTQLPPLREFSSGELVEIRQQLNMSRPVFAKYLRTNPRTLENWEQGRAKPNAQATTLIRLVQQYPETLAQLAALA